MPAELAAPSLAAWLKLAEAKAIQAKLAGNCRDASAIEAQGWEAWLRHYFGSYFSRPFTAYQQSFWADWAWTIQADTYYRPRVECEPRGVGKSTNAEAAVVSWIARQRRSMIGYVSLDEQKAEQHFNTIKTMLESESLVGDYPHCKPAVQKVRSMATQWSREAIVTGSNAMIVPITLRGSRRGWKSSTGKRFDALILDDIDELGMSPGFQRKMLELLKSEILAAGDDNTLILMPENLIHRDSICARILDHRADILSDRIFCGPYPLLKWYDAEKTELDDGSRRWKIISGEAFDEAIPIPYAEKLLNKYGKATFDRECQQEVAKVEDDKDFREYDEMYHVITWSEFEAYFSQFKYELRHPATGKRKLPDRWHKGKGLDWGTTSGHPAACVFVTRPDQNSPLSDCHFVFGEVILPRYPLDVTEDIEVVSPGRVARAIRLFQEQWGLAENSFEQALMSHEASAALNTFRVDLSDDIKVEFAKWKAQKGSGVPQIQNVLEIDYSKPHPFRRHPQTGEPLKGRPRKYLIVDDDQGALFVDDVGKLRVQGAKDSLGLARLRYEIPLYQHTVSAKDKKDDDAVDAWRGLMSRFAVTSDPKTESEQIEAALPEGYRASNAPKKLNDWSYDGWELGRLVKIGEVKKAIGERNKDYGDNWQPRGQSELIGGFPQVEE